MKTEELTAAAEELQNHLEPKVSFYLRVGWIKEKSGPELVVYYDEREPMQHGLVPFWWRGISIRVQGVLPPGVQPPVDDVPVSWIW